MHLEILPNEILLDLFIYFNGTDLLRAFYGLNSRFNVLLYKHFRWYRFRFNSVSKRDFDMICQQHLPFIADRVIALQLSNYKTSGQINLFCSYISSFDQFTHLRSLTLSYLRSYQILINLLYQCHHLNSLTHLNICHCHFPRDEADFPLIINTIWSLPKLTNCHFRNIVRRQYYFCVPTIISTSLECLTIFHSELRSNQIYRLFQYTPRLKRLSTFVLSLINDDYIVPSHPMLIQLNIRFLAGCNITKMIVFFQSTPNLRHLSISITHGIIDGHQWEQIIRNSLPKLKTFQLKMKRSSRYYENVQEEVDKLLDSFRSSFWIDEHQWFVRCFTGGMIHLCTVSSKPDSYETISNSWKWTCPHDNYLKFYNNMTGIDNEIFFDEPIASDIRLPNIKHLDIKFPINDQFWSIVPSLNKLKTLSMSSYTDNFQSELQALLDRAPHLHTLHIGQVTSLPLQMSLFNYTNASIRELDLWDCKHYFNKEECLIFSRSSLGAQCEDLSIRVNNCENIMHLIKNMVNLRILSVYCKNEEIFERISNDEVVQWLEDHLPSTSVVNKDPYYESAILIWI